MKPLCTLPHIASHTRILSTILFLRTVLFISIKMHFLAMSISIPTVRQVKLIYDFFKLDLFAVFVQLPSILSTINVRLTQNIRKLYLLQSQKNSFSVLVTLFVNGIYNSCLCLAAGQVGQASVAFLWSKLFCSIPQYTSPN